MLEFTGFAQRGALIPATPYDVEMLSRVPRGETMVRIWQTRDPGQRRFFFSCIRAMVQGGLWEDEADLRKRMLIATGWSDPYLGSDGMMYYKARSMKAEEMDAIDFVPFMDKFFDVVREKFGVSRHEMETAVKEIGGDDLKRYFEDIQTGSFYDQNYRTGG